MLSCRAPDSSKPAVSLSLKDFETTAGLVAAQRSGRGICCAKYALSAPCRDGVSCGNLHPTWKTILRLKWNEKSAAAASAPASSESPAATKGPQLSSASNPAGRPSAQSTTPVSVLVRRTNTTYTLQSDEFCATEHLGVAVRMGSGTACSHHLRETCLNGATCRFLHPKDATLLSTLRPELSSNHPAVERAAREPTASAPAASAAPADATQKPAATGPAPASDKPPASAWGAPSATSAAAMGTGPITLQIDGKAVEGGFVPSDFDMTADAAVISRKGTAQACREHLRGTCPFGTMCQHAHPIVHVLRERLFEYCGPVRQQMLRSASTSAARSASSRHDASSVTAPPSTVTISEVTTRSVSEATARPATTSSSDIKPSPDVRGQPIGRGAQRASAGSAASAEPHGNLFGGGTWGGLDDASFSNPVSPETQGGALSGGTPGHALAAGGGALGGSSGGGGSMLGALMGQNAAMPPPAGGAPRGRHQPDSSDDDDDGVAEKPPAAGARDKPRDSSPAAAMRRAKTEDEDDALLDLVYARDGDAHAAEELTDRDVTPSGAKLPQDVEQDLLRSTSVADRETVNATRGSGGIFTPVVSPALKGSTLPASNGLFGGSLTSPAPTTNKLPSPMLRPTAFQHDRLPPGLPLDGRPGDGPVPPTSMSRDDRLSYPPSAQASPEGTAMAGGPRPTGAKPPLAGEPSLANPWGASDDAGVAAGTASTSYRASDAWRNANAQESYWAGSGAAGHADPAAASAVTSATAAPPAAAAGDETIAVTAESKEIYYISRHDFEPTRNLAATVRIGSGIACSHHLRDRCNNGASCRFLHPIDRVLETTLRSELGRNHGALRNPPYTVSQQHPMPAHVHQAAQQQQSLRTTPPLDPRTPAFQPTVHSQSAIAAAMGSRPQQAPAQPPTQRFSSRGSAGNSPPPPTGYDGGNAPVGYDSQQQQHHLPMPKSRAAADGADDPRTLPSDTPGLGNSGAAAPTAPAGAWAARVSQGAGQAPTAWTTSHTNKSPAKTAAAKAPTPAVPAPKSHRQAPNLDAAPAVSGRGDAAGQAGQRAPAGAVDANAAAGDNASAGGPVPLATGPKGQVKGRMLLEALSSAPEVDPQVPTSALATCDGCSTLASIAAGSAPCPPGRYRVLLGCDHVLCGDCLAKVARANAKKRVPCPSCGKFISSIDFDAQSLVKTTHATATAAAMPPAADAAPPAKQQRPQSEAIKPQPQQAAAQPPERRSPATPPSSSASERSKATTPNPASVPGRASTAPKRKPTDAEALAQAGDIEGAVAAWGEIIDAAVAKKGDKALPDYCAKRAALNLQLDAVDDARADADRGLKADAAHVQCLYQRARALHKQGRHGQAVSALQKVIAAQPDFAEAAELLSIVKADKARAAAEAAASAPEAEEEPAAAPAAATTSAKAAPRKPADRISAWVNSSIEAAKKKEYGAVVENLSNVFDLFNYLTREGRCHILVRRAIAYFRLKKPAKAKQDARRAEDLNSVAPTPWPLVADLLTLLKDDYRSSGRRSTSANATTTTGSAADAAAAVSGAAVDVASTPAQLDAIMEHHLTSPLPAMHQLLRAPAATGMEDVIWSEGEEEEMNFDFSPVTGDAAKQSATSSQIMDVVCQCPSCRVRSYLCPADASAEALAVEVELFAGLDGAQSMSHGLYTEREMLQSATPPASQKELRHLYRLLSLSCITTGAIVDKPPKRRIISVIPKEIPSIATARFKAFFKAGVKLGVIPKWLSYDSARDYHEKLLPKVQSHCANLASGAIGLHVLPPCYIFFALVVLGDMAVLRASMRDAGSLLNYVSAKPSPFDVLSALPPAVGFPDDLHSGRQ